MSIRWQLFGYLTLLLGVLLVVLWLFQVVFMDRFYKSIKTKEIIEVGRTINRNFGNSNISEIMNTLAERRNLCIVLTNSEGYPIYTKNELILVYSKILC